MPEGNERPQHIRDKKPEHDRNGDAARLIVPRCQVNVQQHLLRVRRVELPYVRRQVIEREWRRTRQKRGERTRDLLLQRQIGSR